MQDHLLGRQKAVAALLASIGSRPKGATGRTDTAAAALASEGMNVIETRLRAGGGRMLKRVGHAVLSVFETTDKAVLAAVALQQEIESPQSALRIQGIHVRVGICRSGLVVDGDDGLSDALETTTGLVNLARPGEIFLTKSAQAVLPDNLRRTTRLIREEPESDAVFEFVWRPDDTTVRPIIHRRGDPLTLEITVGTQRFVLGRERQHLTIGRGPDNDVVIDQPTVSRHHAEIVSRDSKFLLVDRSSNGTFVSPDSGEMFSVCREEFTLVGAGRLLVGSEATPPLKYRVRGVV